MFFSIILLFHNLLVNIYYRYIVLVYKLLPLEMFSLIDKMLIYNNNLSNDECVRDFVTAR